MVVATLAPQNSCILSLSKPTSIVFIQLLHPHGAVLSSADCCPSLQAGCCPPLQAGSTIAVAFGRPHTALWRGCPKANSISGSSASAWSWATSAFFASCTRYDSSACPTLAPLMHGVPRGAPCWVKGWCSVGTSACHVHPVRLGEERAFWR